ncbi:MAG: hypothetical protein ACO3JG_11650 [Luteolibacter sp.]
MKPCLKFAVLVMACGTARADVLTEQERETLLRRLEALQSSAEERVDARFRAAIAAYSSAAGSPAAAGDFYLKCVEKVNFTDQKRKSQDFREWKRREDDKMSSPGFGLALQIQLRWLILTLQAASENADRAQLASAAQGIVNSMVEKTSTLAGHKSILGQAVTSSVFAKAYEIHHIEVEKWALAPGDLGAVYGEIILPPLRARRQTQALRTAWSQRIQQELALRENEPDDGDANDRRVGLSTATRSPAYERFAAESLPQLQWEMEADLFKHGDQRAAAGRMLGHIEKHITHKKATQWGEEFVEMLAPELRRTAESTE